jgi:transposase-like protein
MMAERGISIDHLTVHRWALKLLPVLERTFRRCKRTVGRNWRMDESRDLNGRFLGRTDG